LNNKLNYYMKLFSNGVSVCMNVGSNPITYPLLFPGLRLI
jgi:hypothetical protein